MNKARNICDPIYGPMLSQTRDDYPESIRREHNDYQRCSYEYKYHEEIWQELSSKDGNINSRFLFIKIAAWCEPL